MKSRKRTEHISQELAAYVHNELPRERAQEVGQHLLQCPSCRQDYEAVKRGTKAAELLPVLKAPEGLWEKIEPRLEPSHRRASSGTGVRWWAVAAALLLPLFLVLATLFLQTAREGHRVVQLEGGPRLAGQILQAEGRLDQGQWLTTDEKSRARIQVSDVGEVDVEPQTRIRLVQNRPNEQRMELRQGKINARIWAPPRLFFVETPSALAVDLGCAYTLEVGPSGEGLLQVTSGWVGLERNEREVVVPAGAACEIDPQRGPAIPYFEGATEEFRASLGRLSRGQGRQDDVQTVLVQARPADALSLWYLLYEVSEAERMEVFARLRQLAPHPEGVTPENVKRLDDRTLFRWRDLLEGSLPAGKKPGKLWRRKIPAATAAPVGAMKTARQLHSATRLADGRVLIAGGINDGKALAEAEVYYPVKHIFASVQSMNQPRAMHTATLLQDGRVLMAGGVDNNRQVLASAEVFDSQKRNFLPGESLKTPRYGHTATLLADGRVLIAGGVGPQEERVRTAEIYDPDSRTFQEAGLLIRPRQGHTATRLQDGRVLLAGGAAEAELYDPGSGEFQLLESLRKPRWKHAAVALTDGRVAIVGGVSTLEPAPPLREVELFDPAKLSFSIIGELTQDRYKISHAAVRLPDGKLLVAGGGNRLEIFDPLRKEARLVAGTLGGPRYYSTATELKNGQVLILGGYSYGDRSTADAWIYQP